MVQKIIRQLEYLMSHALGIVLLLCGWSYSLNAQHQPPVLEGFKTDTILYKDLKFTKPAHLALDTVDGHLFVSDPGKGALFMVDRQKAGWKEIFRQKGAKPDFIALDMAMKIVYWTDRSDGSIWRSNYDGSKAMPVWQKRNEVMEFLTLDKPGNRLIYLDSKSMAIKSITTMGTDPGVVFKSKSFNIKAIASSVKDGILYIGIESLPEAKLDYRTISKLDIRNRKSEPLLKNCTNVFSAMFLSEDKLMWTDHDPGKLYIFSLSQDTLTASVNMMHNATDIVWDRKSHSIIYLAHKDKFLFTLSAKKASTQIIAPELALFDMPVIENDSIVGNIELSADLKDNTTGVDSFQRDTLISIQKTDPPDQNKQDLKPATNQEKMGQASMSGKYYIRIHEVRITTKSGNSFSMFLHSADNKNLYGLSPYYMSNDYPRLHGQENLHVIPLEEVNKIRIGKYFDLETTDQTKVNDGFKPRKSHNIVLYGGLLGLGADVLVGVAVGSFIFPTFTLLGGAAGVVIAVLNSSTAYNKFRAVKLDDGYLNKTIALKKGIAASDIQYLISISMKEIKPDSSRLRKTQSNTNSNPR